MRAYGAGKSCAIIFFDKNFDYCNEMGTLRELGIRSNIFGVNRILDQSFRFENIEEDFTEAKKALGAAREIIKEGAVDVFVLDEILNMIRTGLVAIEEVLQLIDSWPREKYLVLTGRGLPREIAERADLISEINVIRHPFLEKKIPAQRGIDY